jgi:hypothetical protein
MKRAEVVPAFLEAAPSLRRVRDEWRRDRAVPGDGPVDELQALAHHLADPGRGEEGDLRAALGVAERCLIEGDGEVRGDMVPFAFLLPLWQRASERPGGLAYIEGLLPPYPYCLALWEVCPEVHDRLRRGVEQMLKNGRREEDATGWWTR